jgi:GTP-binding protein
MLDKSKLLAITKSDLLDAELQHEIEKDLPALPYVFISSVAQKGLQKLKDMIWNELNKDVLG